MAISKGPFGVVVVALGLLIAMESWLALAHPLARLPVATIEQGEAFNSIAAIEKETQSRPAQPYMVLMGSSLMVAPVVQAESQFRNHPIKRFFERRATACEEQLNQAIGPYNHKQIQIFNAAIGGGMASDDYFVTRKLLHAKNRPVALICGVAPRDFQDNLVPETYATSAYQVFANLGDLEHIFADKNLTVEKKFDIAMGRASMLWRNRAEVKSYFGLLSKKLIERVCPSVLFEKYGATLVLKQQKKGIFPEEVKGTPMAYPGMSIDHYDTDKTLHQYMRSYNPVNNHMFGEQLRYFEQMLTLTKEQRVKLLVVNMPLSKANKALMPDGFYARYLTSLEQACARCDVPFVDYDKGAWDENGNFIDSVHLRTAKSQDFIASLMKSVVQSPLSSALSLPQSQLRRQKLGAAPLLPFK